MFGLAILVSGCIMRDRLFTYGEVVCHADDKSPPRACVSAALLKLFSAKHLDRESPAFLGQLRRLANELNDAERLADDAAFHAAAYGAVRAFGDGHSRYIEPLDTREFDKLVVEGSLLDGKTQEHTVRLENNVAIMSFSVLGRAGAGKRFAATARETLRKAPSCVVLDLRGNVGGIIEEAADVLAVWLPAGYVYAYASTPFATRALSVSALEPPAPGAAEIPLWILVDGRTASAAEMLALGLANLPKVRTFGASAGRTELLGAYITPGGGRLLIVEEGLMTRDGAPTRAKGVDGERFARGGDELLQRAKSSQCRG